METSEEINEVMAAFTSFQKEIDNPEKNSTVKVKTKKGSTYSYKYATLDSIVKQIQKVATKNGLSFSQEVQTNGDASAVGISTYLFHESGQWIKFGPLKLKVERGGRMNANQAAGSTITYARRYALASMAGLASEEDTDTSEIPDKSQQNRTKPKTKPKSNESGDLAIEDIKQAIAQKEQQWSESAFADNPSKGQINKFNITWRENIESSDEERYAFLSEVTNRDIESSKELLKGEVSALIEIMTNHKEEFIGAVNDFINQ